MKKHSFPSILLTFLCLLFLAACGSTPEMSTFESKHFSIKYPRVWIREAVSNGVSFSTRDGGEEITFQVAVIELKDQHVTAEKTVDTTLTSLKTSTKQFQEGTKDTVMYANTQWQRGTATFDVSLNGVTLHGRGVILAVVKGNFLYKMIYIAEANTFDDLEKQIFHSMLESFIMK